MLRKNRSIISAIKRVAAGCIIGVSACYSVSVNADVSTGHDTADTYVRWIQASHFLSQATMGATVDATVALANRIDAIGRDAAFNEWIDDQFQIDPWYSRGLATEMLDRDGLTSTSVDNHDHDTLLQNPRYYREHVWWHQSLFSQGQLSERMTWALYQIMPAYGSDNRLGWANNLVYMDLLKRNAFGNHRVLLEDVTYSPMMGVFLSSMKNDAGDEALGIFPDENYAREVMQLFSVGVYDIVSNSRFATDANGDRVENYTNDDISQLARVFTGLSAPLNHGGQNFWTATGDYAENERMIMYDDHHHKGSKTFLGKTLPANQAGDQDISDALDILFNYHTTPYFFSNLLIQRFTTSTPNVNYLARVAEVFKDNGQGVRGDFKAVIRAILMDSTVRDSLKIRKKVDPSNRDNTLITVDVNQDNWENDTTQGRLREPMLQLTNFFRFFEVDAKEHESSRYYAGDFKPIYSELASGQSIRGEISIFGYYNADYLSLSGPAANMKRNERPLVLPEFELLGQSAIILNENIANLAERQSVEQRQTVNSEYSDLPRLRVYTGSSTFNRLIRELNVFLFAGTMSTSLQNDLLAAFNEVEGSSDEERLARVLAVLLISADFAVTI